MEHASDQDDSGGQTLLRGVVEGDTIIHHTAGSHQHDVSVIHNCYCFNCEESHATTTLLPTNIPLFREIIILALTCPDCHFRHSSVTFGGKLQERGSRIRLQVCNVADLNRCIVKSDSATLQVIFPSSSSNSSHDDGGDNDNTANAENNDSGVENSAEQNSGPLEFEIPATTQQGTVAPLEGILLRAASNLEAQQPERLRLGDLDNFYRCKTVIERLRYCCNSNKGELEGEGKHEKGDQEDVVVNNTQGTEKRFPFVVVLDDPAGNSFIESTTVPKDPAVSIEYYDRSPTQDMMLGLQPSQAARDTGRIEDANLDHKNTSNGTDKMQTVLALTEIDSMKTTHNKSPENTEESPSANNISKAATFTTPCPNCQETAETNMCVTDIPHFKEIVIMSMVCDSCGYRNSDIKAGGSIPTHGTRTILSIQSKDDLQRELLLSDTAGVQIPEIELELGEGGGLGGGGAYTTVEGLIKKLLDRLREANPFAFGDAAEQHHLTNDGGEFSTTPLHSKYRDFLAKLKNIGDGNMMTVTLILNDPLSNSFIGPLPKDASTLSKRAQREGNSECYNNHDDNGLVVEVFERTFEQNEALGLNYLKTENYAPDINTDYGTDRMEGTTAGRSYTPGGPDHPHPVAKAPVDKDTTIMGNQ